MEIKKSELETLLNKSNTKTGEEFLKWLKKYRKKSIKGRRLTRPYYKNKRLIIESASDLMVASELCERLVEISNDLPNKISEYIFAFRGIINKIRLEAFKFEKNHNIKFDVFEASLLMNTDKEEAAKFALNVLNDLDIPFNDYSSDLYEILIDLDIYYTGMDRLNQRRLLSLTYRDIELPLFFANDNVFIIFKGNTVPMAALSPKDIELHFGSKIPPNYNYANIPEISLIQIDWDYLILDKKDKGYWIYNNKKTLIGSVTANAAKVLKILLKPTHLLSGTDIKSHNAVFKTRKLASNTRRGDTTKAYRKSIRDVFTTSENKNVEFILHNDGISIINPELKIVLVSPSSIS